MVIILLLFSLLDYPSSLLITFEIDSLGNGFGVKIAGGREIPSTREIAAFVSKIYPGGTLDTLGEVREGTFTSYIPKKVVTT